MSISLIEVARTKILSPVTQIQKSVRQKGTGKLTFRYESRQTPNKVNTYY